MIELHKYQGYTIMICRKQKPKEKDSELDTYLYEKCGYFSFIFNNEKEIVDKTFDIPDASKALEYAQNTIDFALRYQDLI